MKEIVKLSNREILNLINNCSRSSFNMYNNAISKLNNHRLDLALKILLSSIDEINKMNVLIYLYYLIKEGEDIDFEYFQDRLRLKACKSRYLYAFEIATYFLPIYETELKLSQNEIETAYQFFYEGYINSSTFSNISSAGFSYINNTSPKHVDSNAITLQRVIELKTTSNVICKMSSILVPFIIETIDNNLPTVRRNFKDALFMSSENYNY